MDKFDDGSKLNVLVTAVAKGIGTEEHQRRSKTLSAATDDVVSELVDQADIRVQLGLDQAVYTCHILPDQSL